MESGVWMEKNTNISEDSFSGDGISSAKVIAMLLLGAVVCYVLAQCVMNGMWFVALGVIALMICAAFGALLIYFSQRIAGRKAFDITEETKKQ